MIAPWPVVLPPPEPYQDDDMVPVYDFIPCDHVPTGWHLTLPEPRYPDVRVFGPEGPDPLRTPSCDLLRTCAACDVKWARSAGAACWNCGRSGWLRGQRGKRRGLCLPALCGVRG